MTHFLTDGALFRALVIVVGVLGVGVCLAQLFLAIRRPRREVPAAAPTGDRGAGADAAGGPGATYLQVADTYRERAELFKAVAVYRQVLKVDPDLVDARIKLAACYQQLGLASEALVQYQAAAYWYEKAGETGASARVRQMVQARDEPEGRDASRLVRTGDGQARAGALGEAVATYRLAADTYRERGDFLRAVAVYKQILSMDPDDGEVSATLEALYRQLGLAGEAPPGADAAEGDAESAESDTEALPVAGAAPLAEAPPRGIGRLVLAAMGLTLATGLLGLGVNRAEGLARGAGALHPLFLALGLVAVQAAVTVLARALRASRAAGP